MVIEAAAFGKHVGLLGLLETVVHAALNKLGVPGADADDRGLEKILVVGWNVMNKQRSV
jgi:hypothetical protein